MVTCPTSTVINSITFASYGTPTGSCGSFVTSSCDSTTSRSIVSFNCLGQHSCSISAGNANFGNPCLLNDAKTLNIQVGCTGYAYSLIIKIYKISSICFSGASSTKRWILGESYLSCDQVCREIGSTCSPDAPGTTFGW